MVRDGLELFLEISRRELRTKIVKRDFGLIAKANILIDTDNAHHTSTQVAYARLYSLISIAHVPLIIRIEFSSLHCCDDAFPW